jgi:hypothetical protein
LVAGLVAVILAVGVGAGSAATAAAGTQPATGRAESAAPAKVGPQAGKPGTAKPVADDPIIQSAAKRFGLSAAKIEQALVDVKTYVIRHKPADGKIDLLDPALVKVFATSLGVPTSKAKAVLKFLTATWKEAGKSGSVPAEVTAAAVKFLANRLHISKAKAEKVWATLQKIGNKPGGTSVKDPAFVALARSLHLTPKQLDGVLVELKQFLGKVVGKPKPGDPGKPKPGEPGKPKPGEPPVKPPVKP